MADNSKQTVIEDGTEFEGSIKSKCAVKLSGKVSGKLSAPMLTVTESGCVDGKVKVDRLKSEGEIAGEIDADAVELAGCVSDQTVIKANTLEVKLNNPSGGMQVMFGNCQLQVGDPAAKKDVDTKATYDRDQQPELSKT